MKQCSMCKEWKNPEDFHRRKTAKDGRQYYCKECGKKHYKKWKDWPVERKDRFAKWKAERLLDSRLKYVTYMKDKCCVDCGNDEVIVLVHDHIGDDKTGGVLELINKGAPWRSVLEEINKCEIVCQNCHTKRTAQRGNWWILEYCDVAVCMTGEMASLQKTAR